WLRDFANLKNTERGRVTCGSRRFTPQAIESVRERARVQQLRKGRQRRRGDRRDQFGRDTRTHLINTPAQNRVYPITSINRIGRFMSPVWRACLEVALAISSVGLGTLILHLLILH